MSKGPENNTEIATPSQEVSANKHLKITWKVSFRGFIQDSLLSEWERVRAYGEKRSMI